jgi:hypothetical protein
LNTDPLLNQKVLIMVSVIDSLGAISNKTIELEVAPPNLDINSRLTQIEVYFNSSLSIADDLEQKIYQMNIAALEINQIGNYDCLIDNCKNG